MIRRRRWWAFGTVAWPMRARLAEELTRREGLLEEERRARAALEAELRRLRGE